MKVSLWGFVAYLMLYASVITGTLLSSPSLRKRVPLGPRAWEAHQLLSLGGLGATAIHTYGGVSSPLGNRIPVLLFVGPGSPLSLGMALGVSALYATALVTAVFYLRHRLGASRWRILHALAYPAFVIAAWHSAAIGANAWLPAVRFVYTITLTSAGLLVCARLVEAALNSGAGLARRPAG